MSDSDLFSASFAETVALHERVAREHAAPALAAARAIARAFDEGRKLLLFGNGGSAADAQHAASEFVGRFLQERRGLPAIALTTDASVLTSVANDYAFDRIFARQIEALGRPGDVAFGISTSGASANVIAGLHEARAHGMVTVALTGGDGGEVGAIADVHVNVPSASTPRVQEVHRTLLHVMCDLVERSVCPARDGVEGRISR